MMDKTRLRNRLCAAAALVSLTWSTAAVAQDAQAEEAKARAAEAKAAAQDAAEAARKDAAVAQEAAKEATKDADAPKATDQQPAGAAQGAKEPQPKTLVTNLDNPSGLAIHPESGHVFIATRVAVYHYAPKETDKAKKIGIYIEDYPTDNYGKGPVYQIGPLGLAFFDKQHLVVGGGSRPDGEELIHVYEVKEDADHGEVKTLKESDAKFTIGPIGPQEGKTAKGEGNFYGLAVAGQSLFITCNGDDTFGWIARSQFADGKFGDPELFIASKEKIAARAQDGTGVDAPGAATVSADGKQLVVSQKGEVNVEGDSMLTFYNPETGELTEAFSTGLNDIVGVAQHPTSGEWYVTDFSWVNPAAGGLYRLKNPPGGAGLVFVQPEKVAALDKPTACAFDKEGNLYVTVFGTAEEGSNKSPGRLVRFAAKDLQPKAQEQAAAGQ